MTTLTETSAQREQLVRGLNLFDATLIVVGTTIGSGIFLVPSEIAREVHTSGLMLLVWIVGGLLSFLGALTYAELSAAYPHAGGLYVYLREAFGRPIGFLYGWTLFLVIHTGSIATLAKAVPFYLGYLAPLSPLMATLIPIAFVILFTIVNCLGLRLGATVQNFFAIIKVTTILALLGSIFLKGKGSFQSLDNPWPQSFSIDLLSGFGVGMIAALWAYEGWHLVTFTGGEIKDPNKNLPCSLALGTAIIIAIYLTANIAYLYSLSVEEISRTQRVAATAMEVTWGPIGGTLISVAILISILGATNGTVLTGPRVFFAMARDGLFFKRIATIHPRFKTPAFSIIVQGLWAAGLTLIGSFSQLFTYVLFAGWIFYGLTAAAVIVLRHKRPDLPRPYKVSGYPLTPIVFVAISFLLVINTLIKDPRDSLLGLAFIALGIPVYLYWNSRQRA